MDKKFDLLGKLIVSYAFILAIGFLIYSLVVLPVNEAEKVSAIIGLLGWSATFFAPIAAYVLLDNWKDQKKYELKKEYIGLILNDLRPIFTKILIIYSNVANIDKVKDSLVINKEYLDYKALKIGDKITNSHGNLKLFSKIDKNSEILEAYEKLEMHCFFLDQSYKEVIKTYTNYYDEFMKPRSVNIEHDYDINREYLGLEKNGLIPFVHFLSIKLSRKGKYIKRSEDGKTDQILELTIFELLDNLILHHNQIQDICLDNIDQFS